jgi:hypothetical protein
LETAQCYPLHWLIGGQSRRQQWSCLPLAEFLATEPYSFKPYLNIAIPYVSSLTKQWEPRIQQADHQELPLVAVQQTLVMILKTLAPTSWDTTKATCVVENLAPNQLRGILQHVTIVVVNHPVGASDAYRFNIREAILDAGLVPQPDQICFVEDVVAAFLPELPIFNNGFTGSFTNSSTDSLTGNILVVSAGATTTDLALVKPGQVSSSFNQENLSRENLLLRRMAYAGNALDQDIIYQLLNPSSSDWESLGLRDLDQPLPGEPDLETRYRLQQRLEARKLGRSLLKAIRQVKPALCRGDISFRIGDREYSLRYQDLHNWVIAPYAEQLGREMNSLLRQANVENTTIQRVICAGGTASIPAIAHWLQQKFPQAQIVQDSSSNTNTDVFHSPRIAQGLARLPYFPDLLDATRHQYSELFLLRQMLKVLTNHTDQSLSKGRILQLLAARGIPIQRCEPIILGFLEGQLPIGLIPSRAIAAILTPESRQNQDYQSLLNNALFASQGNQIDRLSSKQRYRLWNHLQAILAHTQQKLKAPLAIGVGVGDGR